MPANEAGTLNNSPLGDGGKMAAKEADTSNNSPLGDGGNNLFLQKNIELEKQTVIYKDLGTINYQQAWDLQEELLQQNVQIKAALSRNKKNIETETNESATAAELPGTDSTQKSTIFNHNQPPSTNFNHNQPPSTTSTTLNHLQPSSTTFNPLQPPSTPFNNLQPSSTQHYLLLCEHPPVYTLGKSGNMTNILISDAEMELQGIEFFKTNRGGDITFHGPGQIVGYPILDLEKFYTDIGRYLRELEQVIIDTLAFYGIKGERSKGETGVWIEPGIPGRERKICAMGVRCSRWITMHGLALNVNTDLAYFENIIPCGIVNKQVTSMAKELQTTVDINEVKATILQNFEAFFGVQLI